MTRKIFKKKKINLKIIYKTEEEVKPKTIIFSLKKKKKIKKKIIFNKCI